MSKNLIIRLDDASNKMDITNWNKMESLLDKYNIKPIVGIIPDNNDPDFVDYLLDKKFYIKAKKWQNKGWHIAMHGYNHVFNSNSGGINPVNNKSEFAGLTLEEQRNKIKMGYEILINNELKPKIFFAPAHTFDKNTIEALKLETDIKIISDTIANDVYYENDIFFIPQQSGKCRKLPFKTITYCFHPNVMSEEDFDKLELFLKNNQEKFNFPIMKKKRRTLLDYFIKELYFLIIKVRRMIK